MNLEQLGRLAANRLGDAIDGIRHSGVDMVTGRIVTRRSTAPLD